MSRNKKQNVFDKSQLLFLQEAQKGRISTPFLTFSEFGQISLLRASRPLARPKTRPGGPKAILGRPAAKKATKKGSLVAPLWWLCP